MMDFMENFLRMAADADVNLMRNPEFRRIMKSREDLETIQSIDQGEGRGDDNV